MKNIQTQNRNILLYLIFLVPGYIFSATHSAEDYRHREIKAIFLNEHISIDGVLDEKFYSLAPIQNLIQLNPDNGELVTEETHIWIGYMSDAVIVGARMFDSEPDKIISRVGRRDSSSGGDEIQFALDTYYDGRSGFAFGITPSGSIMDGKLQNDTGFDISWNGVWESAALLDELGWTVEMRIPFSQLRFEESPEQVWGVQVVRTIARKNERAALTWYPRGETGNVSRFAVLKGLENITQTKRIEFLPYLTGGVSHLPAESNNAIEGSLRNNLGIGTDIKMGLGSSLTLDAAINPDFGQVEVDPAQINLSAYEIYYKEKRPFFVEGKQIFSFGSGGPSNRNYTPFTVPDLFYSRRIGRPVQGYVDVNPDSIIYPDGTAILGAGKISGKLNENWSIGGLSALTNEEYAQVLLPSSVVEDSLVEPLSSYNLLRLSREYGFGRAGVGMMGSFVKQNINGTAMEHDLNSQAMSFGVDGWVWLDEDHTWGSSIALGGTHVSGSEERILALQENSSHNFQRPGLDYVEIDSNRTSLNGYYGRLVISRQRGRLDFNYETIVISPGFDSNDMGITGQTDRIFNRISSGWKWLEPGNIFRFSTLNASAWYLTNFGGTRLSTFLGGFFHGQFLNYMSISIFGGWGPENKSDQVLWGGPLVVSPSGYYTFFNFNTNYQKDLVLGIEYNQGGNTEENFDRTSSINLTYKLGSRMKLSFSPSYSNNLTIVQYYPFEDTTGTQHEWGVPQLKQEMLSASLRINYTLSPLMSFQSFIQPFIWQGIYSDFKEFIPPYEKYKFQRYYMEDDISNYSALVFNSVFRWEFQPGSTFYFVLTRSTELSSSNKKFELISNTVDLLKGEAANHLAIKITYWID